jgi:hypothetical protein
MERSRYDRFADDLVTAARRDPDVIGLVAMGSFADRTHSPDEWSDHDLWLITKPGAAARLREDIGWLPDADRIVGHFIETEHGRSIVYEDGHLIEMAVFESGDLAIASANDYRVLYDTTGGLEAELAAIVARTTAQGEDPGRAEHAAGRFITTLIIGLGRYGRGELISAGELIREHALAALLRVIADYGPPPEEDVLDNLDPHRRVEIAYPVLATRIDVALRRPVDETAAALLEIARELVVDAAPPLSAANLDAVQTLLNRAKAAGR